MSIRWTFTDPITTATATFEINPNTGGSPAVKKKVAWQTTTAAGAILFEGRPDPSNSEFGGVILSDTQYAMFLEWVNKPYPVSYTDDLGRTFSVYLTELEPRRVRNATRPWRHDYTFRYLVLGVS